VFSELVLAALQRRGWPRTTAHRHLATLAQRAQTRGVRFRDALTRDERVRRALSPAQLRAVWDTKALAEWQTRLVRSILRAYALPVERGAPP
jgi:adenylosuccinate lyase